MRLRREAGVGVGALVGLMVSVAFGTIVLLNRMGPAVGRILEDNVASEEAVEDMLATLASPGAGADVTFADALERARDNVTEAEEPALVEQANQLAPAALSGDRAARQQLVSVLRRLGTVNRESMRRSDEAARRLGLAGAWAAAFLGTAGFAVAMLIYRRIRVRLELPIDQVRRTLERARADDFQARCRSLPLAPVEVVQIASHVNWLLDHLQLQRLRSGEVALTSSAADSHRALLEAMDLDERPRLLVDAAGRVLAKNRAALSSTFVAGADGWSAIPVVGTTLRWMVPETAPITPSSDRPAS
jgi:hypothetical protein